MGGTDEPSLDPDTLYDALEVGRSLDPEAPYGPPEFTAVWAAHGVSLGEEAIATLRSAAGRLREARTALEHVDALRQLFESPMAHGSQPTSPPAALADVAEELRERRRVAERARRDNVREAQAQLAGEQQAVDAHARQLAQLQAQADSRRRDARAAEGQAKDARERTEAIRAAARRVRIATEQARRRHEGNPDADRIP